MESIKAEEDILKFKETIHSLLNDADGLCTNIICGAPTSAAFRIQDIIKEIKEEVENNLKTMCS